MFLLLEKCPTVNLPFQNPIWRRLFRMAAIFHVKFVFFVPAVKSVGRFEWSWCPFQYLKAADIISHDFVTIWKSKMAPTLKDGFGPRKKSVGRFERWWFPVACFKGYMNHWYQLCSPPTCHFFNVLLRSCVSSRELSHERISFLPCVVVWGLDGGLVASNSHISFYPFWYTQTYMTQCLNARAHIEHSAWMHVDVMSKSIKSSLSFIDQDTLSALYSLVDIRNGFEFCLRFT